MNAAKHVMALCLSIALFLLTFGEATASSPKTIASPVWLKINQYYVLYTSPQSPYIDQRNRLMLPLRSVSELLGADVSYTSHNKTANVSWKDRSVEVTIQSDTVKMNGKSVQIDTHPVLKENQIFLPVKVLLDGLGIEGYWDNEQRLLSLTDERFYESDVLVHLEAAGGIYGNGMMDTNEIRPLSYEMTLYPNRATITIQAQNRANKDLAEGREDLHPTFISHIGTELSFQTDHDQVRERPEVKADAVFERNWEIDLSGDRILSYIVVVGQTID